MSNDKKEIKTFNVGLPWDTWLFLKNYAASREESMKDVVIKCIDKIKRREETKMESKI